MSDIEQRRNGYYSNFTFKGKRIRRTLRTSDPEEAQRRCDELRASLWSEKEQPSSHTFSEAVEIWAKKKPRDLREQYAIASYGLIADKETGTIHTLLSDINADFLAEILDQYQGTTRNRHINRFKAILNIAVSRGWLEKVPHMESNAETDGRIRWLTKDEWDRLREELPTHLKQMARFSLSTGLRSHNVSHLEWSQLDMQNRVAWVHPDQAKGKKAIGIPLSKEAIEILREQIGQHNKYVFTYLPEGENQTRRPVFRTSTPAWWKALKRAEIENFRWHDLRHTWASWHVMAGTPIEVLQKLGGWKTLALVMKYAHLAPDHLASFADNSVPKNLNNTATMDEAV